MLSWSGGSWRRASPPTPRYALLQSFPSKQPWRWSTHRGACLQGCAARSRLRAMASRPALFWAESRVGTGLSGSIIYGLPEQVVAYMLGTAANRRHSSMMVEVILKLLGLDVCADTGGCSPWAFTELSELFPGCPGWRRTALQ